MKTRDRILDTALELMNQRGMDEVSTYDMARALGIRQSNITYYFPSKTDIVRALARRLVEEVDALSASAASDAFSWKTFYELLDRTMQVHQKYRFILMHYAHIITSDKTLNQHFIQVLKRRPAQFEQMMLQLERNGYVRAGRLLAAAEDYTRLLNMLAIYWVQESAIYMPGRSDKSRRKQHLKLFFQVFEPFLTPRGKKQLREVMGG